MAMETVLTVLRENHRLMGLHVKIVQRVDSPLKMVAQNAFHAHKVFFRMHRVRTYVSFVLQGPFKMK
jgi:hypothetical protein